MISIIASLDSLILFLFLDREFSSWDIILEVFKSCGAPSSIVTRFEFFIKHFVYLNKEVILAIFLDIAV